MFSSRDRLLRSRLREEFIVTMSDGSGWRGVLYAADDRTIALRGVTSMTSQDGQRRPVDGELILERSHISFMQRP